MSKLLTEEILSYIGHSAPPKKEIVTRRDIQKYSIATGQRQKKYIRGDEAPPMFHVSLFWDVVELEQLMPDGVSKDILLPEFPLKKAMAGGLKIDYHKPIYPGDWLTATRTLTDIYEKVGSSGPLIFYEVVMEVVNEQGEKVITEKTTRILR
ncbi:FAS1-like dehydratase domain-containing protein [Desertibacillus haloalkaliphilus]|uniref:FAS1-like dehydratase domain-containing protein n=1 Tax=Desertibacillus haloalkaliphilus TaxID=1328930 RepID=UPI001C26BC5D|nr:MaoC family dehydratase N-terminal domain-containing protein [Desertibacillus haloalkaliphilus]MBU8906245.1 MaoC family dehydratase N-terminal domain-containing protein [Desertibacillus haloalkaliphilus]